MPRNDDLTIILAKAKKQGFLPDVSNAEVDTLEVEARNMYLDDAQPTSETLTVGEASMPRYCISTSAVAHTTGYLRLTYFTATKTETVTTVRYNVGATSAAATPTLVRFGLYLENADKTLTLVASTPNDTTCFSGGTFAAYTKAFSASYTKQKGQRYAIAVLIVSAFGMPSSYGNNAQVASAALNDPKISAAVPSQSDLPNSVSVGALGSTSNLYYLEVF